MNTLSITRLNKYISEKGICSRREADKLIEAGRVFLNGSRAKLGDHVKPGDKVMVNGQKLELVEEKPLILLALNKPAGIVSTTETTTTDNIVDFVNHSERVFPIGRLDKDSQGLILLTNEGDLVNKILRAGNKHEKEYIVTVNKPITDEFVEGLANGVPILGEVTKKCKVVKESPLVLRMTLVQGKNRQIRRMCEHFSYEVTKLERVRIMNITLKGIPLGDWRELTEDEIFDIMKSVENSSSDKTSSRAGKRPRKENRDEDFHAKRMANPQHKSSSTKRPDKKPTGKSFKTTDDHSYEGELSQDGFETRKKSKPRDPEDNTTFEKEKKSFKEYRSGSSRKPGEREARGERKSDEGRKPYGDKKSEGGRKSFDEKKSEEGRKSQDGRKPFGRQKAEGGRSSEEGRRPYSDRKAEGGRSSEEGRKSYGERKSEGGGKPWSDRKREGDRKTEGGSKPWSDRKAEGRSKSDGGSKPWTDKKSSGGRKSDGGGKFWSDKKSEGGRKSEGRGFGKSKPASKSPSRSGGKKSSGPNSNRPKSSGR